MTIPELARFRQSIPRPRVGDVPGTIRRSILESRLKGRVPAGGRVAIGVGSRGIGGIAGMARAAVDATREMGFRPFVVAAMGSHGGATAEGQRDLLASLGITGASMGAEVRSEMETVVVGSNPAGLPIHFDRNAFEADGIVLLGRVKPHTDFRGTYESGILKMLTIGLGKKLGAEQVHKLGLRGLTEILPAVGSTLIRSTPFALGLAILENADEAPAEIAAIEPEDLLATEPILLERARGLMGRLPFDRIDVLVVGELGKNYSGAGLDPNVIGRMLIETQADLDRPVITRLAVLDLSEESRGNAVGVGFADLTTDRLVSKIDPVPLRLNVLTACFLERARVPIHLPTDLATIEAAVATCWRLDPAEVRMVVVPNTLELSTFWASGAFEAEAAAIPHLDRETGYRPLPFPDGATLDQESLFPESVRSRRAITSAPASV